ncbi:MAG TPA: 16S rRNA (cytidine(1402)-2'-O)-methyltransferase [Acidimicrobiales bacterium]|nr:16S rRNA (cytidine(1402)-2'-O)-methyltransferase [Acidimicrobiales bacterium]
MTEPGRLVLVATPIGNLGDLSPRARDVLAGVDVVCCEDTRRTRQLLSHAGITGQKLLSVHEHNEMARLADLIDRMACGATVALVSDAGTPAVSDPGARLVAAAAEAGIEVSAVPGPNAALMALVVSGLATDRFCFEGFLPRKGAERRRRLEVLAADERTTVIHETAPRLVSTLEQLAEACGPDRMVAVARELTKVHEEVWRGTLAAAVMVFAEGQARGEIVVVVAGAPEVPEADEEAVVAAVRRRVEAGDTLRDAASAAAVQLGVGRRRAYELGLADRRNAAEPGPVAQRSDQEGTTS